MNTVTSFGLFAVTSMLVIYALEKRRRYGQSWQHEDGG